MPNGPSQTGTHAEFETALATLKSESMIFAQRFIQDANVRADYMRQTEAVAKALRDEVTAGRMTSREAATAANGLRNEIMAAARVRSSDIGRAQAQATKASGKLLQQLEIEYAKKLFGKPFATLSVGEKNKVWLAIVESSGRANPKFTAKSLRLARLGRGLIVLSVACAVYNVATAEDKGRQVVKEGATVGSGFVGGAAGGALAGLACGPGAPVCVTAGVFIGGALGALGADFAFERWR